MKRRDVDQIIHLAFGELAAEDAARVESTLKPEANQLLGDFRSLKSDLILLNRVPEPQIGVERIREAILRRGLKKERSYGKLGLIFGPCLVAALALFFVTAKPSEIPTVPSASTVANDWPELIGESVSSGLVPKTELTDKVKAIHEDVDFPQPQEDSAPVQKVATLVRRHKHHVSGMSAVNSGWVANNIQPESLPAADTSNQGQDSGASNLTPAAPASAEDSMQGGQTEPKVTIVTAGHDGATGAETAKEVDPSVTNVVFGS